MSIAGHVSREMLNHYSHIRLDAKRQALAALETAKSEAAQSVTPQPCVTIHGTKRKTRRSGSCKELILNRGEDLNLRPPGPEPEATLC
jgi:hypothetical protein